MSLAEFSLQRPFTVAAGILLVCLLAVSAFSRMAMDIFPEINIPVIAVVWNYAGMSAPEMRDRIATLFQRQVAQEVDQRHSHRKSSITPASRRDQVLDDGARPALAIDIDRARALEFGLGQQSLAANLVTSLNNSLQLSPNFWLDRKKSALATRSSCRRRRTGSSIDSGSLDASGHRSAELSPADADERREIQSD